MYGFGAVGGDWGGFLSDVVRVPWADHMLVPLPRGPRSRRGRERVGQHPGRLADRRAAAASASRARRCSWSAARGPGSIGLYAAGIAVALGAESVTYVDADAARRATAAGVRRRWRRARGRAAGPVSDHRRRERGPRRACSWRWRSTAPDGVCTSTAIYFGEPVPMPLFEMYIKVVTFETGRVHARPAMPGVLDLAAGGDFRPEEVTSRVVAWDDAPAALAGARLGEAGRASGRASSSILERASRPAEPLLRTALRDFPKGFCSQRPEGSGRLPGDPLPAAKGSVAASLHVARDPRRQERDQEQQHAEGDYGSDQHGR